MQIVFFPITYEDTPADKLTLPLYYYYYYYYYFIFIINRLFGERPACLTINQEFGDSISESSTIIKVD
jgi:hypothetical protein